MNEEVRIHGVCAECGDEITDEINEYYCDTDGNLFCSHECILEHFNVSVMEG